MKKVAFYILIITIFLLNGCGNESDFTDTKTAANHTSAVSMEYNESQTELTDDSWKYEVAERLYDEFFYFYEHRNDDMSKDEYYINYGEPIQQHTYTNYNVIMAADRAEGVRVYQNYLTEDKISHVMEKNEELNEKLDWCDRVCFGYSETGMHYIAIMYNHITNSYYSSPMCDKIRDDYNESNFMEEIFGESLYVQDVFVEDLSKQKNEFNLELQFSNDFYFKNKYEPLAEISPETKGILKKYNRTFESNKYATVKNNTWNIWLTEMLVDYLSITYNGEKTVLQHYAPTQQ
ncbi:MAG: hypothetical protein UH854_02450 [Clostridia bacterium]|nr:hypothetical protein [Clostridia bacterium]